MVFPPSLGQTSVCKLAAGFTANLTFFVVEILFYFVCVCVCLDSVVGVSFGVTVPRSESSIV